MSSLASLAFRNLRFFWRSNLAVVAAVAVATGVLTGALLVGDSVRGSLRELFVGRLGKTEDVVLANGFFGERLAEEIASDPDVVAAPLVVFQGMVTNPRNGRRRADVLVYGVDDRFFHFHENNAPELSAREALPTRALSDELEIQEDDAVLLRVEKPSDVSRGSLHGTKEDVGRTLRLQARGGLAETGLPEFSIYPRQDEIAALFVSLSRLQRDLEQEGRVNTILVRSSSGSSSPEALVESLRRKASLDDLSVQTRLVDGGRSLAIESRALVLAAPIVAATREVADELSLQPTSFLTYLANSMRVGSAEVPYSLVTAMDRQLYETLLDGGAPSDDGIVLNHWAGQDLGARPGDGLTMDFYVWEDEGRIATESATFTVDAIVPMTGPASDRDLAPSYPGISETENLSDWSPPFPIDLNRVRDKDEDYWDRYRTTPKAFLPLARGQALWPMRQGNLTSIRLRAPEGSDAAAVRGAVERGLRERLDPLELGFSVVAAREQGLTASRGATDFGEYFVYFSYFLVMAALLLTGLFFKLGVERRHREIGTLLATGFTSKELRKVFLLEGLFLSGLGGLLGAALATGYAAVILYGLRNWWVDAVGTRLLTLHVGGTSLVGGLVGGVSAALLATWLTLRYLGKMPARRLLAGESYDAGRTPRSSRRALALGVASGLMALLLLGSTAAGSVPDVAGFFGAGNLVLLSLLAFEWRWLRAGGNENVSGTGLLAMARLGFRNATSRPGRSLVAVALIAFATFIIVSVDAFRKNDSSQGGVRAEGNGGFTLVGESLLPLLWDPNTDEGRNAYNLPYPSEPEAVDMGIETFRLRPGDDASCLNLYRPQSPRILSASEGLIERGGFRFGATLAETEEERANPWLLLHREFPDGAIPVVGDANSMTYVLHLGLGEDLLLPRAGEEPLRLRLVATLSDSIFQSELLMGESRFLSVFPDVAGFRFFLVDVSEKRAEAAQSLLEERLGDFGLDVSSTAAKLASFHRVENTYLSTFQSLGGLGLLLGTLGLGAVLLRNVLERRHELALLRAVGYRPKSFTTMILAENALLLVFGLATGAFAAILAIAPVLRERGGAPGATTLAALLGGVLLFGMLASIAAVYAVNRAPLLASLRAE